MLIPYAVTPTYNQTTVRSKDSEIERENLTSIIKQSTASLLWSRKRRSLCLCVCVHTRRPKKKSTSKHQPLLILLLADVYHSALFVIIPPTYPDNDQPRDNQNKEQVVGGRLPKRASHACIRPTIIAQLPNPIATSNRRQKCQSRPWLHPHHRPPRHTVSVWWSTVTVTRGQTAGRRRSQASKAGDGRDLGDQSRRLDASTGQREISLLALPPPRRCQNLAMGCLTSLRIRTISSSRSRATQLRAARWWWWCVPRLPVWWFDWWGDPGPAGRAAEARRWASKSTLSTAHGSTVRLGGRSVIHQSDFQSAVPWCGLWRNHERANLRRTKPVRSVDVHTPVHRVHTEGPKEAGWRSSAGMHGCTVSGGPKWWPSAGFLFPWRHYWVLW